MIEVKKIPAEVKVTASDNPVDLPLSLQESINTYWESLMASGKEFHRGVLFSIKEMNETQKLLHVTLQKTDFAHFIFAKHCNISDEFKYRAIVANGLILTKDGFFILGQMNTSTANPGCIQFVAGGLDQSDIHGNTVDIFGSLIRETKEEIGIDLSNNSLVLKVEPRYLVHWGSVALVYLIQLNINSTEFLVHYEQFEKRLNEKGIEPEFSSILLLPADYESVSDFLEFDERPKLDFLGPVLKKELNII